MSTIWKHKKGANDVSYIAVIVSVFVLLGVFLPYIKEGFSQDSTDINVDGFEEQLGEDISDIHTVTAFDVVLSVASMFFWTFGALPFWLDAFFIIVRIIFAILFYRLIRSGGG